MPPKDHAFPVSYYAARVTIQNGSNVISRVGRRDSANLLAREIPTARRSMSKSRAKSIYPTRRISREIRPRKRHADDWSALSLRCMIYRQTRCSVVEHRLYSAGKLRQAVTCGSSHDQSIEAHYLDGGPRLQHALPTGSAVRVLRRKNSHAEHIFLSYDSRGIIISMVCQP